MVVARHMKESNSVAQISGMYHTARCTAPVSGQRSTFLFVNINWCKNIIHVQS